MSDTVTRTPEPLAAGRELDALVAEKIMGWRDVEPECYTPSGKALCGTAPDPSLSPWRNGRAYVPRFSEDIGAAWEVVEHLRAQGWEMSLSVNRQITAPWDCRFVFGGERDYQRRGIAHAAAAPEAICRAALKAVGDA